MIFFERFYALAKQRNTSVNAVAKELKLSSAAVTAWKNGTDPKATTVAKIATYFDVTTDYLLGLTDYPNMPPKLHGINVAIYSGAFDGLGDEDINVLKHMAERLRDKGKKDSTDV